MLAGEFDRLWFNGRERPCNPISSGGDVHAGSGAGGRRDATRRPGRARRDDGRVAEGRPDGDAAGRRRPQPALSWQLSDGQQTAYRVLVADSPDPGLTPAARGSSGTAGEVA